MTPAEAAHLLALADDEHLMGQQHTEWIGTAPFLEEDLAFCSIAQDELGHAAALYELLGDADALAFSRQPHEYRSCALVELPCADWELALARHWLYDVAEQLRWDAIDAGEHAELAGVVARAKREETYHRAHVATVVDTLRGTGGEARQRLDGAVAELMADADALWEPVDGEDELVESGFLGQPSSRLRQRWRDQVEATFGDVEWGTLGAPRGTRTQRTEHFAALHERITEVFRIDPGARW